MLARNKGFNRLRIFDNLGKKYHGIYTLFLGSKPVIVVTDVELIKRVLNEDVFAGRPKRFFPKISFRHLGNCKVWYKKLIAHQQYVWVLRPAMNIASKSLNFQTLFNWWWLISSLKLEQFNVMNMLLFLKDRCKASWLTSIRWRIFSNYKGQKGNAVRDCPKTTS